MFFALHTIGGRYTYSNVPYDAWSRAAFGRSITETFGFTRNHYDRLVHLSYGLLAVYPIREFLQRHLGVSPRLALYIAVESVIAVSALYELFEWLLSIVLAGPMADDYNGQQGDMWDTQKDMALATIGAFLSALFLRIRAYRSSDAAGSAGRAAAARNSPRSS
jgi:putative membrane protein